jgi:hypothetical protein
MNIRAKQRLLLVLSIAATVIAFGCGGESELDQLRAQAAAKEAEARSLAVNSPCSSDNECGALVFGPTTHVCGAAPQLAYLLAASTSARAASAAEQQRSLASQVQALLPSDGLACPAVVPIQPAVSCLAAQCVSGT